MQVLQKNLIISNINEPETDQPSCVIQVLKKEVEVYQTHIAKHI
jgi:hypothetical protein